MSLPLLFTLAPSNRHEIILLDTSSPTLKSLNAQISSTIASSSPNCAEFMGKYKAAEGPKETIQEMKIHWDTKHKSDARIWPEYTVVTDENFPAILKFLERDPTMGVLEIKVGKPE